jgi:hypothetical protein
MRDNGKGDTPRPLGVPMEVFDKNFEAIFGKKQPKTLKDYIEQKEERNEDADSGQQSTSVPNSES